MYSRKRLENTIRHPEVESEEIVANLLDAMQKGAALSLAEEEFLGIVLGAAVDEEGHRLNMHDFKGLQNDLFRHLYPLYVRNRDGLLRLADAYGNISSERREQDVNFLETEYQKWRLLIASNNQDSATLQHLSAELKKHLGLLDTYAKKARQGTRLHEAATKEIVLHSKYLLHFVDAYYQELGAQEQTVTFAGGKIVVDSYAYIHILFRHYSQSVKPYQSGKSYHFDTEVDHTTLPSFLIDIIASYFRNLPAMGLQDDRIFVRIRGKLYALWFRKMTRSLKGNAKETYHRLQTFYPVTEQADLLYAGMLKEIVSDDGIGLLHKK